ncbi:MAG: FG-GAP-like repeat-containing protein [Lacunisphaera sp.]
MILSATIHAQVNLAVNASQTIRTVDERVFGVNAVIWDAQASSAQTITMVQNAGIRTIRVPGGSLSDEYHWRINKSLANTWSWATAFNGFINLITSTNTQPVVTVNYGSGTPEEAAGLVAYLNASVGSSAPIGGMDGTGFGMQDSGYWASLRAAVPLSTDDGMNFLRISRSSPVGAKYFEIGNECYGTWETDQQTLAHDPTTYANRVQQYIAKMKAVDPTIKIGVVVVTSSENASYKNWTPTMLARLKALNAIPDFIIYHLYPQAPGAESDATLLQVADAGSHSWTSIAADLRNQLSTYLTNQASGVEIVVTENNSVYSSPGKQSTSLVNGLYLADSIGNLMKTEINGYMYWALRNGTPTLNNGTMLDGNMSASLYGWRQFGDYGMLSMPNTLTGETTYYDAYPTYYMMKLLSYFARGGDTVVSATSTNPLLSIFAAKRADGSLSLLVINKDPTNVQNASIALSGYTPGSFAAVYSYGKPEDAAGGAQDITTTSMAISGPTFSASFASYSATVLSVASPGSGHVSHSDFNGDGKSDVFLSNTVTGDRAIWLMNGLTIGTNAFAGTVPVEWKVSGTGDFNGDGKSDVLWTNTTTGDRAMWLMNGSAVAGGGYLGSVPVEWVVSGTGDFNGDGKSDIIWTNTVTGERAVWLMNGSTLTAGGTLGVIPVAWVVSGTGDFNGDGKTDILLSNTITGDRVIWFMNGTTIATNAFAGTVPVEWIVSGVGDFDGDGKADIMWTNTATGDRAMWLMNGSVISAGGYLGSVPTEWVVSSTGDYDGDGKADLLWSNTVTGEHAIWLMNGVTKNAGASLGVVPVAWAANN